MESTSENTLRVECQSIATNLNTVFKAFDYERHTGVIAYSSANLVCILE